MPEHTVKEQELTLVALRETFEHSLVARKIWDQNWDKWLQWVYGNQRIRKRSGRRVNTVVNLLFSQLATEVPILTSNAPGIRITPVLRASKQQERWDEIAEGLTQLQTLDFRRNQMMMRMAELATYGIIFGSADMKVVFNPELLGGFGAVQYSVPDTRQIYSEPGKLERPGSNYIFERTDVDILTLTRRHPELAVKIRNLFRAITDRHGIGSKDHQPQVSVDKVPTEAGQAASTNSVRFYEVQRDLAPEKAIFTPLIEGWFHDEELVEMIKDDHEEERPKEPTFVNRYPNGRVFQWAGNIALRDHKNHFPGIPYFQYKNYFLPGLPYGFGDIEPSIPIQEQYNIRNNQIYDRINYHMHPIRLFDDRAGLTPGMITNQPNAWIPVHNIDAIKELRPDDIGLAVTQTLQRIKEEMETQWGVHEVTRGTIPGQIESGAAIEALQEAADVRLRQKSRNLEATIMQVGAFSVDLYARFYKSGIHYPKNLFSKNKNVPGINNITSDMFEFEVTAGVNRGRSRFAQSQELQFMFDREIIKKQDYVKHSNIDSKDDLFKRLKPLWELEEKVFLAQLQQAMAQGGQGPVPGTNRLIAQTAGNGVGV